METVPNQLFSVCLLSMHCLVNAVTFYIRSRTHVSLIQKIVKMASNPVNITKLNLEGLKKFLDTFDHVFSDCDGVIWANSPLPGSGEFVRLMKKLGKTVHFVSNNSIRTKEDYENQFEESGIQNGFENLTIPSLAIVEFLKSKNFNKHVYCVSCPETKNHLRAAGFKIKDGPDIAPDFNELAQFFEDDPEVGAVVLDGDTNLNLPKMYRMLTYLKRHDVFFISGATDKYWVVNFSCATNIIADMCLSNGEALAWKSSIRKVKSGHVALGAGFFTRLVADEAKREPIQLGKPGKIFGEFAMKRAGYTDPSRVLFIGDMIAQDVGLGKAIGFKTLLVLSHHSVADMLAEDTLRPDFYAKSLGTIVPLLKKL